MEECEKEPELKVCMVQLGYSLVIVKLFLSEGKEGRKNVLEAVLTVFPRHACTGYLSPA